MTHIFLEVDQGGRVSPMSDSGAVGGALTSLIARSSSRIDGKGRRVDNLHSLSLELMEQNFRRVDADLRADSTVARNDDFAAGLGMFNPRDLTYKFKQAMEERLPPLNSLECFPVDTQVPPGALTYEQSRVYTTGQAVVYRGGTGADVPAVGLGTAAMQAPVVYLVSKVEINWLEQLRIGMTGIDTRSRKILGARRVIAELENKWAFQGAEAHGLYGLLNHPYMDTVTSTVVYGASGSSDDIAADFATWANYADNESGSTFRPNCLMIAPKLANYLRNRKYADDASKSLMDWMLAANPHITSVKLVRELNDAGGAGIHAMSFSRIGTSPTDSSLSLVKPMMATMLPPETRSLGTTMYMVSAFGGLNQTEAGDNLVVYVEGGE